MILSMTGYGKTTVELADKKVHIEIRSLNSKAMDLSVRLASCYREKEMSIRQMIAQTLERGKTDVNIWIEKKESASDALPLNRQAIKSYYENLSAFALEQQLPQPSDWMSLLMRLPEVLTQKEDTGELDEAEWTALEGGVRETIDALMDFRRQEGRALEVKFREKIAAISDLLAQVEPYETARVKKIRDRIEDGLKQIKTADYDQGRLEQELIFYIEKLDISEEKQRLRNHLDYFIQTLEGTQGQGKKLGFISQEMGREINTLGSKSNQAEMQNLVVQMKDHLEQIKEQVLNVM